MTEFFAREIATWTYLDEWSVYDSSPKSDLFTTEEGYLVGPAHVGCRVPPIQPRPVMARWALTTGPSREAASKGQRLDLGTRASARASARARTLVSILRAPPHASRGPAAPGHSRPNRAGRSSDLGLPPRARGGAARPERRWLGRLQLERRPPASVYRIFLADRPIGKRPDRPGSGLDGLRFQCLFKRQDVPL